MKDRFTVFVLLFGDNSELAARCLASLCQCAHNLLPDALRVGLNACGSRTQQYVRSMIDANWIKPHNVYISPRNIHKYPMMRHMFNDPENPVTTPYMMWFDDDSYIKAEMMGLKYSFAEQVKDELNEPDPDTQRIPDMLGGLYTMELQHAQQQWIRGQPWFGGIDPPCKVRFATGGWWAARTEVIKEYDYPWACLDHRGGDVMLGALCQQQNLFLKNFRRGVAINADREGYESKSKRRGFDQAPIGYHYAGHESQALPHKEFRVQIYHPQTSQAPQDAEVPPPPPAEPDPSPPKVSLVPPVYPKKGILDALDL